jgi:hypothetical protein
MTVARPNGQVIHSGQPQAPARSAPSRLTRADVLAPAAGPSFVVTLPPPAYAAALQVVAPIVDRAVNEAAFVAAQLEAQGGAMQDVSATLLAQVDGALVAIGLSGADRCALLAYLRGETPSCPGAKPIERILELLHVYSAQLPAQLAEIARKGITNPAAADCGCGCKGAGKCRPFPWIPALLLAASPLLGLFG